MGYFSSRRGERESWDLSDSIGTGKQCVDLVVYFEDGVGRFPMYSMGMGKGN